MAWGGKSGGPSGTPGKGGALSFIGTEVTISGNISGEGDLHLDGTVEGDIRCQSLILGAGGRIKGNISAEKAVLGGAVGGTVSARTVVVEKTARVSGDISYESLSIETGAQVDGRLTQRGGEGQLKLVSSSE